MKVLLLIPSFFIFLYCFYKFIKDDYVLMRKNISSEQSFDIIFSVTLISFLFSRLFFFMFHPQKGENIFLSFLSQSGDLSIIGGVVGGLVGVYLICKYKRVPLGRFSDFLALAFVASLPLGFLSQIFFAPKSQWILYFIASVLYFIIAIIFMRRLHKRLINRTVREGKISAAFLMFFSLITFFFSLALSFKDIKTLISPENFVLGGIFLLSTFLLIKLRAGGKR